MTNPLINERVLVKNKGVRPQKGANDERVWFFPCEAAPFSSRMHEALGHWDALKLQVTDIRQNINIMFV